MNTSKGAKVKGLDNFGKCVYLKKCIKEEEKKYAEKLYIGLKLLYKLI